MTVSLTTECSIGN